MTNSKEVLNRGPVMTRREFLLGAAGTIVVGALSSSCGRQPEQVDKTSVIASPETAPTKAPTIEPAPTREVIGISETTITEEYLRNAFVGVGGGERVGEGQAETSLVEFGLGYVSESWGEEVDFTRLPEESVASLKYLVSLGAYRGEEGFFAPGKQGGEVIFPQLAELSLARLTLSEVPSEAEQETSELKEWITPRNFLLRSGTQMTVIGLLNEPKPSTEITIDKDAPGGELNSVLVAFTDYLRTPGESGVPRHYLALLPTHFPADPENRNALSLENLLVANGYQFDPQNQQIVLGEGQKETRLNLNQIKGEALIAEIRKEVGMVFVDQINGQMIKNPIVPYFEEMPAVWDLEETVDEEGRTSFILKSQDQETGDFKNLAQVGYNQDQGEWKWERIFSPEELLAKAPSVEGLIPGWEEGKIVYRAEKGNPYNLQEGEYAGETTNCVFNGETEKGIGFIPSVLETLIAPYNTPEAILAGNERLPLPFDLRGIRFEMGDVETEDQGGERHVKLGLRLPLGTSVYSPISGGDWMGESRLVYHVSTGHMLVPKEAEEECLVQNFCKRIPAQGPRPSFVIEETRSLFVQIEDPMKAKSPLGLGFFAIDLNRESEAFSEEQIGWGNRKELSFGAKFFTVDTLEPVVRYAKSTKYSIFMTGRTLLAGTKITDGKGRRGTSTESLFRLDDHYVFILSRPE